VEGSLPGAWPAFRISSVPRRWLGRCGSSGVLAGPARWEIGGKHSESELGGSNAACRTRSRSAAARGNTIRVRAGEAVESGGACEGCPAAPARVSPACRGGCGAAASPRRLGAGPPAGVSGERTERSGLVGKHRYLPWVCRPARVCEGVAWCAPLCVLASPGWALRTSLSN